MLYIGLATSLNGEESHKKIIRSGSGFGSSPKSNHFVLVTDPSSPQNFVQIRPQLLRYFVHKQTNNQERCAEHDTCEIHKINLTLKIIGG